MPMKKVMCEKHKIAFRAFPGPHYYIFCCPKCDRAYGMTIPRMRPQRKAEVKGIFR